MQRNSTFGELDRQEIHAISNCCLKSTKSSTQNLGGQLHNNMYNAHRDSLYLENPSCLQATFASVELQKSSHTVPHWLFKQTSTRPWEELDPNPASLIAPCTQPAVLKHTSIMLPEYSTSVLMLSVTMTLDYQRADLMYCKYLW